jgi:hypothetical protein
MDTDVGVADSDEMLQVLTDLTAKQRTFSSQKRQKDSEKIVESGKIKLHRDSMAQVAKLKAKRGAEMARIKELIMRGMCDAVMSLEMHHTHILAQVRHSP